MFDFLLFFSDLDGFPGSSHEPTYSDDSSQDIGNRKRPPETADSQACMFGEEIGKREL